MALLGSAGQRAITAGELLGLAGLFAGLYASQKNEYNITVLRGPSIAELNLSPEPIGYTSSERPDVILAVAPEGVERKKAVFAKLAPSALVVKAAGVAIPATQARVVEVDFKAQGIKNVDWSLAALAALAKLNRVISLPMLEAALAEHFRGEVLKASQEVVAKVAV